MTGCTGRGRATLIQHVGDVDTYDTAFAQFWGGVAPPHVAAVAALPPDPGEDTYTIGRYSATEVLRRKDFATYTPEEFAEAARLIDALRLTPPGRRSRRQHPGRRGSPDLRRTVRRALRSEGEALVVARRRRGERPRRLVLVCDISGSMEPYCRALLRFADAATTARSRVEVFALGTRLTRLTRQLHGHDPDMALRSASAAVPDWSGGTRLGDGMRRFNDEWGMRGLARGAVVVILSDGWDRGDPAELAEQMARLGASPTRSCGSTRSRPAPGTPRWPAAWPPRCPTSTSSSRATPSRPSAGWPRCWRPVSIRSPPVSGIPRRSCETQGMSLFDLPPEVADLATSDEALFVVNIEGVVVLMSKSAEELAGVTAEDLVGEFIEMIVPSNKRWGHQAYRRGYFAEPNKREMDPGLEPELEQPDGTLIPIHSVLEPIRVGTDLYVVAHITRRD